jgi:hypothetical protein
LVGKDEEHRRVIAIEEIPHHHFLHRRIADTRQAGRQWRPSAGIDLSGPF